MERFLQLKKLARLQMLREEKILADVIYKCSNQLRQWAGLRRLRWVAKQARIAAFRGKRLSPASVRAVLDTVELQGLEIKRHMADSYLLPVMGILLALLARIHFLLSSAEVREEPGEKGAPETGLDRAQVAQMNRFSELDLPAGPQTQPEDVMRSVKVAPALLSCELDHSYLEAPQKKQLAASPTGLLCDDLIDRPKKPAKVKPQGPPIKRKLVHPFNGFALLETDSLRCDRPRPSESAAPALPETPMAAELHLDQADPGPDPADQPPRAPLSSLRKRPPSLRSSYLTEFRRIRSLIKKCKI